MRLVSSTGAIFARIQKEYLDAALRSRGLGDLEEILRRLKFEVLEQPSVSPDSAVSQSSSSLRE